MVDDIDTIWKKFLSKHWQIFVFFIIVAVVAIISAIYIFLWFVADAQSTGLVPEILGLWSMGHLTSFLLNLLFWEFIFVLIPILVIFAIFYFMWWKKLPDAERKEYKEKNLFGKSSKRSDAGGAIMFLINIGFVIKVYLDGNWDTPFANWTFNYLINSFVTVLIWFLIIVAVPMGIGGLWWLLYGKEKEKSKS